MTSSALFLFILFYNKMVCILNSSLCLLLNNFVSSVSNLFLIPQLTPWFYAQKFQITYVHLSYSIAVILQSYSWWRGTFHAFSLQACLWLLTLLSVYPSVHINVTHFLWVTWCGLVGKHKSMHSLDFMASCCHSLHYIFTLAVFPINRIHSFLCYFTLLLFLTELFYSF